MKKIVFLMMLFSMFVAGCSNKSTVPLNDADDNSEQDLTMDDDTDEAEDKEIEDDTEAMDDPLVVYTAEGPVKGFSLNGITSYKGVPFAKPPLGELRFAPPVPPEKREEVLDGKFFSKACPQDLKLVTGETVKWDEDCLYLNIYKPDDVKEYLPVMVFIHGGGYVNGAASLDVYEGSWLASKDIVLVTINYRLGQLGFLTVPGTEIKGNYGTLDQIAALEWIKDNISGFGGNPENITIFGESAGGISVGTMLALRPDLFKKAVIQSATIPFGDQMSKKDAEETGEKFVVEAGCDDSANILKCLREMTAKEVLETLPGGILGADGESYGPHVDGELFTDLPYRMVISGEGKKIPLIIGTNADEGTAFTINLKNHIKTEEQYETLVKQQFGIIGQNVLDQYPASDYESPWHAYTELFGDVVFHCTAILVARSLKEHNEKVRFYNFTHVPDYGEQAGLGSFHGAELGYLFNTWHDFYKNTEEGYQEVTDNITGLWIDFANGSELEEWPTYDADEQYLEIFSKLEVKEKFKKDPCDFWATWLKP